MSCSQRSCSRGGLLPQDDLETAVSGQSSGMQGKSGSKGFFVLQTSPVPQEKKIPPPVKPKPGPASNSIKEKQLPLLSIFKPEGAPPAAQAPHAPSLPPPAPEDQGRQEPTGKGEYWFHPCGIW